MEYTDGTGKDREEAILDALSKLGAAREEVDIEVLQEEKRMFGILGGETVTVRVTKKSTPSGGALQDKIDHAVTTLEGILLRMGSKGKVEKRESDPNAVTLTIADGEEYLIGNEGETLNALEFILSLIVNNEAENRLFITVDTNNFREERRAGIERIASDAASRVRAAGDPVEIPNLSARERKVIHTVIQNEEDLETISLGEGFNRTIVIRKRV